MGVGILIALFTCVQLQRNAGGLGSVKVEHTFHFIYLRQLCRVSFFYPSVVQDSYHSSFFYQFVIVNGVAVNGVKINYYPIG